MNQSDARKLIKLIIVAVCLTILLIMITLITYGKSREDTVESVDGITDVVTIADQAVGSISKKQECQVVTSSSVVEVNSIQQVRPEEPVQWYDGYTTCRINIRESASMSSNIIDTIEFNQHIIWSEYSNNWHKIKIEDNTYYIASAYVSNEAIPYESYCISSNGFKSFMPYTAITAKTSNQYKIQHNYAYTGEYGIRQVNSRFCVALGSTIDAPIGTYVDLILKNEEIIPCVLADQKADKDTGDDNLTTSANGCVSEFLVDTSSLVPDAKIRGDISYANNNWNSPVVEIRVYDYNIFED